MGCCALPCLIVAGIVTGAVACTLSLVVHAAVDGVGAAAPLLAQPAAWTIPLATAVTVAVSLLDRRDPPPHTDRYLARLHRPDLKVLFITGYAENAVVGNGHLDPGMHVMTKPFAMEALGSRIRELIEAS